MTPQQTERILRRGQLLERVAAQRAQLAQAAHPLEETLDRVDGQVAEARAVAGFAKEYGGMLALLLSGLMLLNARQTLRWTSRTFFAWRTWDRIRKGLLAFSRGGR